jgi:hypothetical protein
VGPTCQLLSLRTGPTRQRAVSSWRATRCAGPIRSRTRLRHKAPTGPVSAVRSRQHRFERRAPLHLKPSPVSPPCLSTASPLPVRNRVPPPLFKLAAVPVGKRCRACSSPVPPLHPRAPPRRSVPTSSTTGATRRSSDPVPVRSSTEPPPPPRALAGEPLLPEMPQSSPPPRRVALPTIPDPPRRRSVLESGRPTPPLPQTPIPSPASAWATCRRWSCGLRRRSARGLCRHCGHGLCATVPLGRERIRPIGI